MKTELARDDRAIDGGPGGPFLGKQRPRIPHVRWRERLQVTELSCGESGSAGGGAGPDCSCKDVEGGTRAFDHGGTGEPDLDGDDNVGPWGGVGDGIMLYAASSARPAMIAEEVRCVLDALGAASRARATAMATAEACCAESMACAAITETAQAATAARTAATAARTAAAARHASSDGGGDALRRELSWSDSDGGASGDGGGGALCCEPGSSGNDDGDARCCEPGS
eukprot:1938543-Prymnesium_polylepis.1